MLDLFGNHIVGFLTRRLICIGFQFFQFAVPIETKNELPWSTVADMLNTKMEKLSRRKLSEENLEHLKHRIPGNCGFMEDMIKATKIEFTMFYSAKH